MILMAIKSLGCFIRVVFFCDSLFSFWLPCAHWRKNERHQLTLNRHIAQTKRTVWFLHENSIRQKKTCRLKKRKHETLKCFLHGLHFFWFLNRMEMKWPGAKTEISTLFTALLLLLFLCHCLFIDTELPFVCHFFALSTFLTPAVQLQQINRGMCLISRISECVCF